jgi:hypothetical protein
MAGLTAPRTPSARIKRRYEREVGAQCRTRFLGAEHNAHLEAGEAQGSLQLRFLQRGPQRLLESCHDARRRGGCARNGRPLAQLEHRLRMNPIRAASAPREDDAAPVAGHRQHAQRSRRLDMRLRQMAAR